MMTLNRVRALKDEVVASVVRDDGFPRKAGARIARVARLSAQQLDASRALRIAVSVVALLIVLAIVWYRRFSPYSGGDLKNIYTGAYDLLHHRDMYAPAAAGLRAQGNAFGDVFFYDPLFFLILSPLTLFSMSTAWTIWATLNGLFLAFGCVAFVQAVYPKAPRVAGLLLAVLVTFSGMAFFGLYFGNADQLLFFLFAMTYLAARRGHTTMAGILLGLSSAIYMQSLPFVLYYLWKREYRTVAIGLLIFAVGVCACFLFGAPTMFANFMTVLGYFVGTWTAYYIDQSLYAALMRIFAHSPYSHAPLVFAPWLPVLLWLGVIAAVCFVVTRHIRRQRIASGDGLRGALEFALALGALFLVFPVLEANTLVSFGLLFIGVLLFSVARWQSVPARWLAVALLAVYLISCLPLTHLIPLTISAHHNLSGLGLVMEAFASVPYLYLAVASCALVYLALRQLDRSVISVRDVPAHVALSAPRS